MTAPLKPTAGRKTKTRIQRLERTHAPIIHDETGHLWAVSYADFLMVLLSFFIIFFSTDKSRRSSLVERLKITATPESKTDSKSQLTSQARSLASTERADFSLIKAGLSSKYSISSESGEKIIVALPDDIFDSKSIRLNVAGTNSVEALLKELVPYKDQLQFIFVGHTDDKKLFGSHSHLQDNYDLSVLRATSALRMALKDGYSPQYISAQGTADQIRNNRSLSVVISNRKDDL